MGVTFKKAIVVGASSGIGEAVARRLAAEGADVALVARREDELARIVGDIGPKARTYAHDVTDFDGTPSLFEAIERDLGGKVDTLVYAAGAMPAVVEGEYAFDKDRTMMEVNVLGAMAWMNLAAARFEAAHAGTIIGISSIAGERGRRGTPGYCTSKAALSTFLESLRNRATRYGVNVVTIKPGFVDTAMTRGKPGLFWLISADEAAKQSLAIARRGSSSSGFVPWRWSIVGLIVRLLPTFLFRRMNF